MQSKNPTMRHDRSSKRLGLVLLNVSVFKGILALQVAADDLPGFKSTVRAVSVQASGFGA